MGRGRAPCCDKSKVKKGPWSPAEDLTLISFIQKHGNGNWRALPKLAGLSRCGKSCRLRWINYLRPDVKRGNFTPEEEDTIIKLHTSLGNKWSKIASQLPGRTDNEIKNVWNTHLKKRLGCKKESPTLIYSSPPSSSSSSCVNQKADKEPLKIHKNQDITAIKTEEDCCRKVDEPKKPSPSPTQSSCSSSVTSTSQGATDVMKSSADFFNHFEGSAPGHEISGLFNKEEEDKEEEEEREATSPDVDDQVVEIPFEPDLEFWDMLDNLDLVKSSNDGDGVINAPPLLTNELVVVSSSHQNNSSSDDGEHSNNNKSNGNSDKDNDGRCIGWMKFLEDELELEGASKVLETMFDDDDDLIMTTKTNFSSKEDEPAGLNCFLTWSPSPTNFTF